MIQIFNSANPNYKENVRSMKINEVEIVSQHIDDSGFPYLFFKHGDYPLGNLRADFDNVDAVWKCDLN